MNPKDEEREVEAKIKHLTKRQIEKLKAGTWVTFVSFATGKPKTGLVTQPVADPRERGDLTIRVMVPSYDSKGVLSHFRPWTIWHTCVTDIIGDLQIPRVKTQEEIYNDI